MISTFWDIPGMRSKNSLEFVAKLLEPIGIYDEQGQTVYASPTFLEILQAQTEEVDFFQYFSSEGNGNERSRAKRSYLRSAREMLKKSNARCNLTPT
jgi:hypothetical protein